MLIANYRDESFLDAYGAIADFHADNNNSVSFKYKTKKADRTGNDGTKDVIIVILLKCLRNF